MTSPNTNRIFTADDGTQYMLEDRLDANGQPTGIYYLADVEPVKKTEKKLYSLYFAADGDMGTDMLFTYLTPTTATKLSEAISALVDFMQEPYEKDARGGVDKIAIMESKIDAVRKSYQESQ